MRDEQLERLPLFARKVVKKLRRFEECATDFESGGVDIGKDWLDILTKLGLLDRVQRSPGLWRVSEEGEFLLRQAPPVPSNLAVEARAREIYEGWSCRPGYVPWVVGGNSLKQEEARFQARAALEHK